MKTIRSMLVMMLSKMRAQPLSVQVVQSVSSPILKLPTTRGKIPLTAASAVTIHLTDIS